MSIVKTCVPGICTSPLTAAIPVLAEFERMGYDLFQVCVVIHVPVSFGVKKYMTHNSVYCFRITALQITSAHMKMQTNKLQIRKETMYYALVLQTNIMRYKSDAKMIILQKYL